MTSTVCCVFDSAHARWSKTSLSNQDTVVFYVGRFSDAASTGGPQVDLESNSLNVGAKDSKSGGGAAVFPVSKKRKFMAVAPRQGNCTQTPSEVGKVVEGPSSSPTASAANERGDLTSSTTATHRSPRSASCSLTLADESPTKCVVAPPVTGGKGKGKRASIRTLDYSVCRFV